MCMRSVTLSRRSRSTSLLNEWRFRFSIGIFGIFFLAINILYINYTKVPVPELPIRKSGHMRKVCAVGTGPDSRDPL
jgi:hypothetical protein